MRVILSLVLLFVSQTLAIRHRAPMEPGAKFRPFIKRDASAGAVPTVIPSQIVVQVPVQSEEDSDEDEDDEELSSGDLVDQTVEDEAEDDEESTGVLHHRFKKVFVPVYFDLDELIAGAGADTEDELIEIEERGTSDESFKIAAQKFWEKVKQTVSKAWAKFKSQFDHENRTKS